MRLYDRGLIFVFRHQFMALLSTLVLIGITGYLYVAIPKGFFPEQDTGFIFGQADAREDISFGAMAKLTQRIVDIVRKDPDVSGVFSFTGASAYNPTTRTTARLFHSIEAACRARRHLEPDQPPLAAAGGGGPGLPVLHAIGAGHQRRRASQRTLYQYTLTDTDSDELNHWAPIVSDEMKKLPEIEDLATDQQVAAPHLAIEGPSDRDRASRSRRLALADRPDALRCVRSAADRQHLHLDQPVQGDPRGAAANSRTIRNGAGEDLHFGCRAPAERRCLLSHLRAHFTTKAEALSVNHQGQFLGGDRCRSISRPGVAIGQAVDAMQQMQERDALARDHRDGAFQGTAQAFKASLSSTPLLVAAAILVVYIVLGVLYESNIHPIKILSALTSAGVGAVLPLMLQHYDLSVIAIIGVVLLGGIVKKKNAIMMIDFALQAERLEGKSPREAIHEACLLRFRPIMMTTFAALFGAMPIALGGGAGSELRRPLGIAIVGGLLAGRNG